MPETAMPKTRVDEQLFRLLKNPAQLEALVVLIERPASKSDVARALRIRLNKADYDVGELEKMGLVEPIDTEERRGQITTIYRAVMRPIWKPEEWGKLSQDERDRYSLWVHQLLLRDVAMAWKAGTFQSRIDAHTTRTPLRVDEQGWRELINIQDEAQKASREVEVESVKRQHASGEEAGLINVATAMFCFEMPSPRDQD